VKGLDTKRFPVEMVSYTQAETFCNRLAKHGRGKFTTFRLATEAEWEYACRAGTRTPFYFGASLNGNQANFKDDDPKGKNLQRTCEVGNYPPNAFGLHDMHGNVIQWCKDWYAPYEMSKQQDPRGRQSGFDRVSRGSGWIQSASNCRSAVRF